jgi:hypothetical protein
MVQEDTLILVIEIDGHWLARETRRADEAFLGE